jgi:hypothetical protein
MAKFQRPPGWVQGRQLTAGERDEARHMLQALLEGARLVRNAIEPQTGVLGLSVGQWRSQWAALTRGLNAFTARVSKGHLGPPQGITITDSQLTGLERRYTPAADQKCVVCSAPLQFSHSDRNGSRYNCSSDDASPIRSTRPMRERQDHYESSRWWDRGQTDISVAQLVRAYRELAEEAGRG